MNVPSALKVSPLLLLFLVASGTISEAAATDLKQGSALEAHLSSGETHEYKTVLEAGNFLSVRILKKNVGVTIALFSPHQGGAASSGSPKQKFGPERLLYLAPGSDIYTLRVVGGDSEAFGGSYELQVLRMGPVRAEDRSQLAAEALFQEAARLEKDHKWSEAQERLSQALELQRTIGDKWGQANTLAALGDSLTETGRDRDALQPYTEAAALFGENQDPYNQGVNVFNCGLNHLGLGEKEEALHSLQQALSLFEATESKSEQAVALHQIGQTYWAIGERQKVLDYFLRALEIHKATGDQSGEARTLNSIGAFYYNVNDNDRALDYFRRALKLDRKLGQAKQVAVTLYNIGERYRFLKEYDKALASFEEALPLVQGAVDRMTEARILSSIGMVCAATGQTSRAVEALSSSVKLAADLQDTAAEADALSKSGEVFGLAGRDSEAGEQLNKSLELDRERGYAPGEAQTLFRLAVIERKNDRLEDARAHVESALGIIDGVWSHLASPEWGALYLSSKKDIYDLYVDILMSLHQRSPNTGFNSSGFAASERARARSLLDLLNSAKLDLQRDLDPELLGREKTLSGSIAQATQAQSAAAKLSRSQQEQAGREVARLLEEYDNVEARLRDSSPRYAALVQPELASVERIQQELDSETVLLEYSLGASRSYLWAIARDHVSSFVLPPAGSIGSMARAAYAALQKQGPEPSALQDLSRILLHPAAQELKPKRIIVVADGAIQYIPFSTLPDPSRPTSTLLARHEVMYLPSASALLVLRQDRPPQQDSKTLAVFADPVFDDHDSRVVSRDSSSGGPNSELGTSLPRLPFTRQEAAAITTYVPPAQRTEALDFDANRTLFLSKDLGQYRIVHVATHAVLNTEHPELSGIVFSQVDRSGKPQDGVVRLLDLYHMRLGAELVVLSACETALGKEIRGEGLVGLTRGFMYAGAPRVVASLWKVDDRATAELMRFFYDRMLGPSKLRPAAALRSAQLALSQQPRWRSPYYWGAFVLQGEWQ